MKIKEPKYKNNNVMLIDDNELDNFINEKILEANLFSKKIYANNQLMINSLSILYLF